jgi:signal transduction histidine kinase
MALQKYDIPRPPSEGGGFEKRYWSPINTPVFRRDGEVGYIIHRVLDVTDFVLSNRRRKDDLGKTPRQTLQRLDEMEAENYNRSREVAEANLKLHQLNHELEAKNAELQVLNARLEQEAEARNAVQQALHDSNAQLERSNRNLELFASVASHDLQEPLHTITSYTELLARKYQDQLDDKARQYIGFIVDGTSHMHNMINDLLAFSRVSTHAKPFLPVDLNSALEQALNSLRQTIERHDAAIHRPLLPQVEGDEVQLAQLFQNLIGNALKFAKADTPPEIRVTCDPSPGGWLIAVHDNGIGIEPRFFDKIFEIFRRLHTRQEYEGTGIGLAICKRIVEHHGGRIWVESRIGEGTSFYFTLRGMSHER